MVSRKARPRRQSIGDDSTTVPPSHERCTRRNSNKWRCPRKRKDGSRHCQKHYDYYQCQGKKKKTEVFKRSSGPGLFLSDQTPTDAKLRLSSLGKKTELKINMESYISAATAREQHYASLRDTKKVKQEGQSFVEKLDEVHLEVELQKANGFEKELGDQKHLYEDQMATTDERYVSLESEPEETSNSLLSEALSINVETSNSLLSEALSFEDLRRKFQSLATSATAFDAATSEARSQLREIDMKLISIEQKNVELEQKLNTFEDLSRRPHFLAASATEKCIQLEGTHQTSDAATSEARSQLREIEMKLISIEQKNVELEQKLNTFEDLNAATSEAISQLREIEMKLISTEQKNVELEQKLAKVDLNEERAAGQRSHCWC